MTTTKAPIANPASGKSAKFSFGTQVLVGMAIGIALGFVARAIGPDAGGDPNQLAVTLKTVGSIFIGLLSATVPPLIFAAIVSSITNLKDLDNAARLAWQTLAWFAITAFIAVVIGIGVGLACGAFNGFLVAGLKLPSIVVTIGTMSLFRGISYMVLGDQAYGKYPADFAYFGQGYVFWVISFEFVLFVMMAIVFAILLHATNFGRQVYVIGNNPFAARFSGVPVERVKFILFLLTGLMSGIAAVCLTSRLGSTRPSIAQGWELEVVTMVVLGGVSILGGSGTIAGVVIAAFVMGLVTFGLGLLNVPGIVMSIFVGLLLIITIAIPIVVRRLRSMRS